MQFAKADGHPMARSQSSLPQVRSIIAREYALPSQKKVPKTNGTMLPTRINGARHWVHASLFTLRKPFTNTYLDNRSHGRPLVYF